MNLPLGKKPFTPDSRDIKLSAIVEAAIQLPTPPKRFGFGRSIQDWGMLGNDQYGDCVFAGAAHEMMLWNKSIGTDVAFDAKSVLSDYSAVTGFDPADPNSDQGTVVREALGYRRQTGVVDAAGLRHKIGAYVALTAGDYVELMQAAYVFELVGIGFEVPATIWEQWDAGQVWDVVDPNAQIEGGHYVPITGRLTVDDNGFITWGRRTGMTQKFYETYCDEAWAMVTEEELRNGVNRRGLDLTKLNEALKQI